MSLKQLLPTHGSKTNEWGEKACQSNLEWKLTEADGHSKSDLFRQKQILKFYVEETLATERKTKQNRFSVKYTKDFPPKREKCRAIN